MGMFEELLGAANSVYGAFKDEQFRDDVNQRSRDFLTALPAGVAGFPGDIAHMLHLLTNGKMPGVPSNWRSEGMQRAMGGNPETLASLVGGLFSPGPGEFATLAGSIIPIHKGMQSGQRWLDKADLMRRMGAQPEDIWDKTGMFRLSKGKDSVWYKEIPGDEDISFKHPRWYDVLSNSPLQKFPVKDVFNLPPHMFDMAPVLRNTVIYGMPNDPTQAGSIGIMERFGPNMSRVRLNKEPDLSVNPMSRKWNHDPMGLIAHELAGHAVEMSNPSFKSLVGTEADLAKYGQQMGIDPDRARAMFKRYKEWGGAADEMDRARTYLSLRHQLSDQDIRNMYGDEWVQDVLQAIDNIEQVYFNGRRASTTASGREAIMNTINTQYPRIVQVADESKKAWQSTDPIRIYGESFGETMARGIENRQNMSTLQRKVTPFWHSVPDVFGNPARPQSFESFQNKLLLVPNDMEISRSLLPYWYRQGSGDIPNPLITGSGDYLP